MRGAIKSTLVILPLLLGACQQRAPQTTPATQEAQSHQIAALIAGTRYLKTQCAYPGLPSDGQIEQAAYGAAHQRGWTLPGGLGDRSENLYQQLLRDKTPQATQCEEFRQLLQPFITTLPRA
ncbi:type II secretion system pilot lipoprotein GspS [Enterobacillus tribolii]|uniref:Type II secretion system protein S n=1 Tax=Enterobacillus tribolii TaxID=1487935 RepID=A0A370Q895_9GAMM|nr:type II secretion system pilot lipoprotein GspS [Enterobacillus tribolii]MBW7984586.1 pullulanase [Enterobacillus tribolii]RDK84576.1 type II secretion system protein S [Enterobacillus tribolii]